VKVDVTIVKDVGKLLLEKLSWGQVKQGVDEFGCSGYLPNCDDQ